MRVNDEDFSIETSVTLNFREMADEAGRGNIEEADYYRSKFQKAIHDILEAHRDHEKRACDVIINKDKLHAPEEICLTFHGYEMRDGDKGMDLMMVFYHLNGDVLFEHAVPVETGSFIRITYQDNDAPVEIETGQQLSDAELPEGW